VEERSQVDITADTRWLKNTALYAFAFFLPIILQDGFGYSYSRANLLTFPPYAVALVVSAAFLVQASHSQPYVLTMVVDGCGILVLRSLQDARFSNGIQLLPIYYGSINASVECRSSTRRLLTFL
jgi:hypothetical protein